MMASSMDSIHDPALNMKHVHNMPPPYAYRLMPKKAHDVPKNAK